MARTPTQNLTILLTDIQEFTEKTSRKTRADILRMLEKHKEIVLPILEEKGGRLIKTIGDAFLVVYESPTDAVLAGVAVQDALGEFNKDKHGDERIDVRIAINAGEVALADGDIFGEPVNITARIESIAVAGQVYFTESVYLAMNKQEVPSSEVDTFQLKGIPEKVKVYKVVREKPVEELPEHGAHAAAAAPAALAPARAPGERGPKARPASAEPDAPVQAPALILRKPVAWRRAGALLLDGIIVAVLASALFGGDSTNVSVRHRPDSELEAEAEADEAAEEAEAAAESEAEGKGVRLGEGLQIDDKGVRLGKDIAIDEKGIRVGKEIEINEKGVRFPGINIRAGEKKAEKPSEKLKDAPADEPVTRRETRRTESRWEVREEKKKKSPAFAILWAVYGSFFLLYWGATPGKRALGLRVVRENGEPLEWRHALVRSVFSVVSGTVVFLGYLWALGQKDGRTWHDLVAGTRVIPAR